jgi:RNA polymerase sigma factor (TIGR02999 family)
MTTPLSSPNDRSPLTLALDELSGGGRGAFARLIELVYSDLRGLAVRRLRDAPGAHDLQPTELVSETVLRLLEQRNAYADRDHFFAIATRLMLRVIIDRQRERLAAKRGGGRAPLSIDHAAEGEAPLAERLTAELSTLEPAGRADRETVRLGKALAEFHEEHPRAAEVVTLHVVGEMPLPRVAEVLGVSLATVERDWRRAKDSLLEKLTAGD